MPTPKKRSRSKSRGSSPASRHSLYALEHGLGERQHDTSANENEKNKGKVKRSRSRSGRPKSPKGLPKRKSHSKTGRVGVYVDRAFKGFVTGIVFTMCVMAFIGYMNGGGVIYGGGVIHHRVEGVADGNGGGVSGSSQGHHGLNHFRRARQWVGKKIRGRGRGRGGGRGRVDAANGKGSGK